MSASKLAAGAAAANIAPGSLGGNQLAPGAAADNLAGSGQAGVASGGIVLSATENQALVNAGDVKIGTMQAGDAWQLRDNGVPPPDARREHTAVWTGSEMIVWGGFDGGYLVFRSERKSQSRRGCRRRALPLSGIQLACQRLF